ncbi:MAG: biopolymer transporter ExbD [Bacteroidales bacterium]|nr:biopolymer transporter ExbD [Bacteroidales bacterium]
MPITTRHKRSDQFSMASMADLVFLLLIFFILLSTLVSPNAINILLPRSESRTMATQTTTVYINEFAEFFVEGIPVREDQLKSAIFPRIADETRATVVLRSDQSVPLQYVVYVIDAVNSINARHGTEHRVILATSPR